MDADRVEMLWKSITILEARECLVQKRIVTAPHLTEEAQKELHRYFYKLAYPSEKKTGRVLTTTQLAGIIARGR